MFVKRYFSLVTLLFFLFSFSLMIPSNVNASGWAIQIHDQKDSPTTLDIKTISARDDEEYLYFKVDGYDNWKLDENNGAFSIAICPTGLEKPEIEDIWILLVIEHAGSFEGIVTDINLRHIEDIEVDFRTNSTIGTMKVKRNKIETTNNNFSMAAMVTSDSSVAGPYDVAPDDFHFVTYKPASSKKGPSLSVSSKVIKMGDIRYNDIVSTKFDVMNDGEGVIQATIIAPPTLAVYPLELELGDFGSETVTVTVDAGKLEPKNYAEKIEIQSKFGNMIISFQFEVLPKPLLKVDRVIFDFGEVILGERRADKIKLSNLKKGPIKGSLETKEKWILISKTNFDFLDKSEEIVFSLFTKDLKPGPIEGTITISSDGGNSDITVKAKIIESLSIDKTVLDFGEIDIDKPQLITLPIIINNNTNQIISLELLPSVAWITCKKEIKIQPNASVETLVSLQLDKMHTINAQYNGEVNIETKFGTYQIKVTAYLKQEKPKLEWITDPPNQNIVDDKVVTGKIWEKKLMIKNIGSGVLEGTVKWRDPQSSFRLFKTSFTIQQGESTEIPIKLDSTAMKLGKYQNTIKIQSTGGELEIPILVEVIEKPKVVIRLFIGNNTAFINDKQLVLEAPPYLTKGTTMVPLRFISDAFTIKIEWYKVGKGRILLLNSKLTIQLDIGVPFAFVNSKKIPLQSSPEIKMGRTFVPLRFIAESLGAKIGWKADTQEITLEYVLEE